MKLGSILDSSIGDPLMIEVEKARQFKQFDKNKASPNSEFGSTFDYANAPMTNIYDKN